MKKIINGKLYNTETAKEMAYIINSNGTYSRNDFRWFEETLDKKKTGEFFLYGNGGPMIRYASHIENNGRGWGEAIIPLTVEEAKSYAEENYNVETYEEIFGKVEE